MTRRVVTLLALAVSCLTVVPASANVPDLDAPDASVEGARWLSQRSSTESSELEVGSDVEGPSSLRTIALLVLVSSLAGAALYMRKRRGGKQTVVDAQSIRVIASTRLGPKAQMVMAQVGGRTILLGVTDSSVRKLAWLDEPAAAEAAPAPEEEPSFEEEPPTLNFEGRPISKLPRLRSDRAPRSDQSPRSQLNRSAVDRFDEVLRTKLSSEGSVVARVSRDVRAADQLAIETRDVFEPSGSRRRKAELRPKAAEQAVLRGKPASTEARIRAAEARARMTQKAPEGRAVARAIDAHDAEEEPARDSAFEGQIAGLSARLRGRVA